MAKRSAAKARWRKNGCGDWDCPVGSVRLLRNISGFHWTTRFFGDGVGVRAEGYVDTLREAKAACERWAKIVAREAGE